MNILFLVVLAAFWLIGGIVKAKSEHAKRQKKIQSPSDSTAGAKATSKNSGELILEKILGSFIPDSGSQQRSATKQTNIKPPRFQDARPRSSPKSLPEKYAMRQKMSQMRKQKLPLQKKSLEPKFDKLTQIEPDIEKLPEFTTEAVKNIEPSYQEVTSGIPVSQSLLDFSDSDSLKKAILYYEVLGRPLSLRESSHPFMEL